MKEHDFSKYLNRNPGELCNELQDFYHAAVVPAYDEENNIQELLESLSGAIAPCPIAVIIVVNYPAGADRMSSDKSYLKLQKTTLPEPFKLFPVLAPELKHGVGEARKTGFDLFCRSRNPENADTSVMFSLDADCIVHPKYFTETLSVLSDNTAGCAAIKVSHRKTADQMINSAIEIYEKYLLDYEKKLEMCGSPYAFNAIGSGFAVKVRDYIKCGGMKLKKAGEDFYFIQSAVKCSKVVKTKYPLVFPSPRISERVPFGTGTAVRDIIDGIMPRQVDNKAYEELKFILDVIKKPGVLDTGEKFLSSISGKSSEFFQVNGFAAAWNNILANQKPETLQAKQKSFHLWFDALQTRRFLHYLSER